MTLLSDEKSSVKEKIIDVAGEIFGRMGYKAATIREICRLADVNVASINYHFGGKEHLYRTVVMDLISRTFDRYPVVEKGYEDHSPEERLRNFVRGLLRRMISPDGLTGYADKGQLMARELADPSQFMDDLVDQFIRPTAAVLSAVIADLLGPVADSEKIVRCQLSVIGQCFHYAMARPLITRIVNIDYADPRLIDALTDHITRFSLAGILSIRQRYDHSNFAVSIENGGNP